MPTKITVKDNKILLTIAKGSPAFLTVVSELKKQHCQYNPNTHEWEISPSRFERVHDVLSDIDRIFLNEDDEQKITDLMNIPSEIKTSSEVLDRASFKMQPIQGKHPYEDFQFKDIWTLYNTNRFALFNEQGTGKSYELITTIDLLRRNKEVRKVLFITSNSGVYNIKREFERFSNINESYVTVGGRKNRRPFDDPTKDIIIMNYRSFLLVADEYQKEIKAGVKSPRKSPIPIRNWLAGDKGILVLDESHYIANPKARQTKALHLVAPFFEYRFIATGTPADKEEKYYSQLRILDSSLVRGLSYNEWLAENFNIGNRFSQYAINGIKPNRAIELSQLVEKHCVRRRSDNVLNLPEQYIRKYYVEFSEAQKEIYRSLVLDKMDAIQNEFGNLNSRAVVNSFPYLILAIDNPTMLLNHNDVIENQTLVERCIRFDFFRDHSKIEALTDIIDSHPNEKIVIWTSHPSVGQKLSGLLKNCLMINGESDVPRGMTLDQYKNSIVDKFQTDPNIRFLIAGIQVMNTSVTLVAANIQIVFDTTFNYTENNQALARIHRIGQDKPVYTYVLLIDESLDITRHQNLERKDFINTKFLSKEYIDLNTAKDIFNRKAA